MIDVNVIPGGSVAFNALLYPEQNPYNQQYFQQNLERLHDYVGMVSDSFIDKAKQTYDAFTNSTVAQIAKAALNKSKGILRPDIVIPMEPEVLHNATGVMQRWIMAEPTVRELYNSQECDGFADTYIDMDPAAIKENHYDYRRVTDGILQLNDDSDKWEINFYTEELLDPKDELTPDKQFDILYTWDSVAYAIANGIDPTNPEGGKL